jgi:hypothetical protein
MPALILSARYTTDSQLLRQAARDQGWETVRIEGTSVPDWFEQPDGNIALFYTAPHAFDIADQLSRVLLGCDAAWITRLPEELLLRRVRLMTLGEALKVGEPQFIKHSVSKAFPAMVYDSASLAEATAKLLPGALVHVIEPVDWEVEYRCFVLEGQVAAISPYRRHERIREDHVGDMGAPPAEQEAARLFASSVLASCASPAAFVLDVGIISGRGWAVVEANECWASGIYSCRPEQVLRTLLRASVHSASATAEDLRWDFKSHYSAARP